MYKQSFIKLHPLSVTDPGSAWTSKNNALIEDDSVATASLGNGGPASQDLVFAFDASPFLPGAARITGLAVNGKWTYSSELVDEVWQQAAVTKNSTAFTPTIDSEASMDVAGLSWISNGGAGDLFGGTWAPQDFYGNATVTVSGNQHSGLGATTIDLDAVTLTIYFTLTTGDTMDFYHAAEEAGWQILFEEALPSLSSAAGLFPAFSNSTNKSKVVNASYVLVTLRGAGITYRGDGNTPTAGGNGIDLPAGGPYEFSVTESEGASFQAIQNGGTATGWIQYWGLKGVTG